LNGAKLGQFLGVSLPRRGYRTQPSVEWRKVKADFGGPIAPKEAEEISQGLTSPIFLVLVLDFHRYWLGEPKQREKLNEASVGNRTYQTIK
jgi:hypothetical protein